MTELDDDRSAADRIARLQRIAFGANATEPERHAAVTELDELQRAAADAAAALAALAAPAPHADGRSDLHDEGETDATLFEPPAASTPTDARGIRWAIAAGVVALALGLGIGWQLGGRSVPPTAEAGSTARPDVLARPAVPATTVQLAETSMPGALSRPPVESDALDPSWERTYGIDLSSARRLLSMPDGLMVFGALRDGDVCLIASYAAGEADGAPACSTYGIVNSEGLRTAVVSETTATTVRWRPDGTVELAPAGERVAEPADAEDSE